MHANALEKVRRHLAGTIRNTIVRDAWPEFESYYEHLVPVSAELVKHKKMWISATNIVSIYMRHVRATIETLGLGEKHDGIALSSILGDERVAAFADQLLAYFDGIPRTYTVYAPIPAITGLNSSVWAAEDFQIMRIVSLEDFPGDLRARYLIGSSGNEVDPPRYFLRFQVKGYCDGTFRSSASRLAIGTLKIGLQQAISRGLFEKREDTAAGLGILIGYRHFSVPKHDLFFVDPASEAIPRAKVELPIEMCRLLDTYTLAARNGDVATAIKVGSLDKLVSTYMRTTALLHLTKQPEALRVKSSIEWAFDAYVNENPTMSFLQTCIALEALYGDGNDGENLTRTLADRCAYLISGDIRGRRTISEKFRALYSARSKIVHGSAGSLDPEDEHHLKWGKSVLDLSIAKEVKHLSLDKEHARS